MNRGDIRAAIFAQADWEPTASSAEVTRINGFINRAQDQVCLEAPFLFHESEVRFATAPDVLPDDTDTIIFDVLDTTSVSGPNAWVVTQTLPISSAIAEAWPNNRTWDGRVIEIITSDGTVYRNHIRTIWTESVGGVAIRRLSLFKPWPIDVLGAGPFEYRIYTEHYYLPDDVIQFKSARLFEQSYNWPLTVLGQDEAEKRSLTDRRTALAAGLPRALFRRSHFSIQGPSVAPAVAVGNELVAVEIWKGPEPPGKFQYLLTYTWGKRDINLRNPGTGYFENQSPEWLDDGLDAAPVRTEHGDDRVREPMWESAPSPPSAEITVADITDTPAAQGAVVVTLPNIEYMQGFQTTGTSASVPLAFSRANKSRSGWHVRIYRKRLTANFSNYTLMNDAAIGGRFITGLKALDISDAFYLLAEVRLDEFNEGRFIDNGSFIPDFHKRHRDIHGYQAMQMYPKPDKRYEVDVRCIRRPQKMDTDQDVPPVHAEAIDMIIHRALVLHYEHAGNPKARSDAMDSYERNLATATKRYSSLRPPAEPVLRQFTRARRGVAAQGGIRRWWKTDV